MLKASLGAELADNGDLVVVDIVLEIEDGAVSTQHKPRENLLFLGCRQCLSQTVVSPADVRRESMSLSADARIVMVSWMVHFPTLDMTDAGELLLHLPDDRVDKVAVLQDDKVTHWSCIFARVKDHDWKAYITVVQTCEFPPL